MKKEQRIQLFVREIWHWFSIHKRTLPWRDLVVSDPDERAYQILVSEVMLQQTQVPRVIITFKEFLRRFPTLRDLAEASNRDVLLAWRGMGYNSRALRLRDAASFIVRERDGHFPQSAEELLTIKGIGNYTAGAIRNFAFGIPTPCIDTNIRRILHRVFVGPENADGSWEKDDKELLEIAREVLDEAMNVSPDPAAWHAALMDFGSLIQTKRGPKWDLCPLTRKGIMKATAKNFPVTLKKTQIEKKKEPGRLVGSTFIPNRIFRGRVVEQLRDAHEGLTLAEIGRRVCIDWSAPEHKEWLRTLLEKLKKDTLLTQRGAKYLLS